LTVALRPEVAESVIVFAVPVVRPTVLLRVEVVVFMPWERAEGGLLAVGVGFGVEEGVSLVPSGFVVDFTGVFLTGVLAVVLAVVGVFEAGVAAFLVLGPLGVEVEDTGFFFTGVVETGVLFAVLVTGVFLTGVEALLVAGDLVVPMGVFL